MQYVDLERRFDPLEPDDSRQELDPVTRRAFGLYGKETWSTVLDHRYVVVLGEAGSGKTSEFRAQADRIAGTNGNAFFVRAEDLVNSSIVDAVDPDDCGRLEAWKGSQPRQGAYFFIDAIDEAKIADTANVFEKILTHLRRDLGGACRDGHFIISCRISDWRSDADLQAFTDFIGRVRPADADGGKRPSDSQQQPLLVKLAPLDLERIRRFAEALGVADTSAFTDALEAAGIDDLASRPRDVEWLAAYWQDHSAFGSLTDMMEANAEARLREQNDVRVPADPLSPDRARQGIEILALAAMLCRTFTIRLPGQEEAASPGVSPERVLPDWRPGEIQALLTRAVFDPATRGRVRFHHRSVQDYLAARCLARLRKDGVTYADVRDLLVRDAYGKTYVVPSTLSLTGWLCAWIPQLRRDLLRIDPDVVLLFGDAAQISVEERATALKAFIDGLNAGGRLRWSISNGDYARIAHPRLSETLLDLLPGADNGYSIRVLLRIIAAGRIAACADAAAAIAVDAMKDANVRGAAVEAAAAAGGEVVKRRLYESARSADGIPKPLAEAYLKALFPGLLDVDGIFDIVCRTTSGSLSSCIKHHVLKRLDAGDIGTCLHHLLELAEMEPKLTGYDPLLQIDAQILSEKYAWTVNLIADALNAISRCGVLENYCDCICHAYILLMRMKYLNYYDFRVDKKREVVSWPDSIRKPVYWSLLKASVRPKYVISMLTTEGPWFRVTMDDLRWLIVEDEGCAEDADRELVFETILSLWEMHGRNPADKERIEEALDRAQPPEDFRQRVVSSLNSPQPVEPEWQRQNREWQERILRERHEEFVREKDYLCQNIAGIRDGSNFRALCVLHNRIHTLSGTSDAYGLSAWQALIPDYGREIAEAARQGFKAYWRGFRPTLPHERLDANQVAKGAIIGLTGLQIAVDDGLHFATLPAEEAVISCRYALNEINGFPEWIEDLARAHPQTVRQVIAEQVIAELTSDPGTAGYPHGLSGLQHGSKMLRSLCCPDLLDHLERELPRNPEGFRRAIEVLLLGDGASRRRLAGLCQAWTCSSSPSLSKEDLLVVLDAWLNVDGDAACRFLETGTECKGFPTPDIFLALASGRHLPGKSDGDISNWTAGVLERLIHLALKHIAPADDNPHPEGAYHPDARDNAEWFRSRLITLLRTTPGAEAQAALRRLAEEPSIPEPYRLHFAREAEEHAAEATEYQPWSECDVAKLVSRHERPLQTADDLFRIALDRLRDIKDDIERGDFSDRGLFSPGMSETCLQKWLAGRLERESRMRYTVVRETEVDLAKKPDIRLHHASAGYVSIEIKPVDGGGRYSLNELIEALETQLVGQYMRATASRHGILVIGMLKQRTWQAGDGSGMIDFDELLRRLNAKAQAIQSFRTDIERLTVFGIDFTQSATGPSSSTPVAQAAR